MRTRAVSKGTRFDILLANFLQRAAVDPSQRLSEPVVQDCAYAAALHGDGNGEAFLDAQPSAPPNSFRTAHAPISTSLLPLDADRKRNEKMLGGAQPPQCS